MSYQEERDQFVYLMGREGLFLGTTHILLRAATTKQRIAELRCSSEAADRDRVPCPGIKTEGLCCCDYSDGQHSTVPRIAAQDARLEARLDKIMPKGWSLDYRGDPRGYVLRVIPPSYAERNAGRDRYNLDSIGVPSGPTRLHW